MNYHNITYPDMNNGDGLRVVLWLSGCSHHCKGCQNPQTWNEDSGIFFNDEAYSELITQLNKDYISGLTLSGGDPLFERNRSTVTDICKTIKNYFPQKTIWCYTGFLYEEVKDLEIMKYLDVLIDSEYKEELRDVTLHWVGSSNQRIIDVKKSLEQNEVVLYE